MYFEFIKSQLKSLCFPAPYGEEVPVYLTGTARSGVQVNYTPTEVGKWKYLLRQVSNLGTDGITIQYDYYCNVEHVVAQYLKRVQLG